MKAKNGFVQGRWRVPDLTPNTPGPAASANTTKYCLMRLMSSVYYATQQRAPP